MGFIVNKNIAGNVTRFKSVSDRLAQLTIRINGKYHLNIIQAYLPTSSHDDQEVESVYEDIDNLITNSKAHYIMSLWATSMRSLAAAPKEHPRGLPRKLRRESPTEDHEHILQETIT